MNTKTRASRKKMAAPLPDALSSISAHDAGALLKDLDTQVDLTPPSARARLHSLIDEIVSTGQRLGIVRSNELVTRQSEMLRVLTGVENVGQYQPTADADRLHTYRNLMVAMATVAANNFSCDPTGVYDSSLQLKSRSIAPKRPLTDDEILLLRTTAYLTSNRRPADVTPAIYVLMEAGMTVGETTCFALSDLLDPDNISAVRAEGNRCIEERFLPIGTVGRIILTKFVTQTVQPGDSRTQTLTYRGTKAPNSPAATASAHGIIDRLLQLTKIANDDITARSIRTWRLAQAYRLGDLSAALQLGGYDATSEPDRLMRELGHFELVVPAEDDEDDFSPLAL